MAKYNPVRQEPYGIGWHSVFTMAHPPRCVFYAVAESTDYIKQER